MALLRITTPRPLFYCSGCGPRSKPAMLKDNDSLGDPHDMAKAHRRATAHNPILVGGKAPPNARGVLILDPHLLKCLWCLDTTYLAYERNVVVCPCIEENLSR